MTNPSFSTFICVCLHNYKFKILNFVFMLIVYFILQGIVFKHLIIFAKKNENK